MARPLPDGALPTSVWRADQLGRSATPGCPSGFAALDAQLPGAGWPLGMLIELLSAAPGIGEVRLLMPVLRSLTAEHRTVILLAPPLIPYAPALASFGIALDHLLIVQAPQATDRLWAIEQTLKSADFGALLAWLPDARTRADHLRRLQLAAQTARGPVFLFRPTAARHESSPAPLRLLLEAGPDQQLRVELLKRRGPLLAEPILLHLPMPPRTLGPRASRRSPTAPINPLSSVSPAADHSAGQAANHPASPSAGRLVGPPVGPLGGPLVGRPAGHAGQPADRPPGRSTHPASIRRPWLVD